MNGTVNDAELRTDVIFGFNVPKEIDDISVLNPRESWKDKDEYDRTATKLAMMFRENYEQYRSKEFTDYADYGPIEVVDK
jgi:phosphoenolpyruvate carboxykinase (ATP)